MAKGVDAAVQQRCPCRDDRSGAYQLCNAAIRFADALVWEPTMIGPASITVRMATCVAVACHERRCSALTGRTAPFVGKLSGRAPGGAA